MSITLKYGSTSRSFSELSAKGFLPGDGHKNIISRRFERLNGTITKKQLGFHRIFTLDLGVLTDGDDLDFIGLFLNSEAQYIGSYSYTGIGGTVDEADVRVVDMHPSWEASWENGAEVGRHIILTLEESTMRIGYPSEQGYGYAYGHDYGDHL